MRKNALMLLLLSCILPLLPAQYRVFPVHKGDSLTQKLSEGFFYTLPRNCFEVSVTLYRTNRYPGPFAEYAERMLGLSGAIMEHTVEYAVKEIRVRLVAENDTAQQFYVEYPKKGESLPVLWRQPSVVTAGGVSFPSPNAQARAQFEMYDNYTLVEKTDTVYEQRVVDSQMVMVPKIRKKLVEKTTAQRAEEALAKIKSIREAQWLLLTGDHEVDFSHLEQMLSELKKEEETYLSLYYGFSVTEEETVTFTVRLPAEKRDEYLLPLFTFVPKEGLLRGVASRREGEIYQISLSNCHYTDAPSALAEQRQLRQKSRNRNLYCRVPEYYMVSLLRSSRVIREIGVMPVSQFGFVQPLPARVRTVELDSLTGAVQSVRFSEEQ